MFLDEITPADDIVKSLMTSSTFIVKKRYSTPSLTLSLTSDGKVKEIIVFYVPVVFLK